VADVEAEVARPEDLVDEARNPGNEEGDREGCDGLAQVDLSRSGVAPGHRLPAGCKMCAQQSFAAKDGLMNIADLGGTELGSTDVERSMLLDETAR
jgi:hypothetical protein